MQVYRGLDIGTAKPSPSDRAHVPHHLIDICDLTETFDAAQFTRLAHRRVEEIQSRGGVFFFSPPPPPPPQGGGRGGGVTPAATGLPPSSKPSRWKACWLNYTNGILGG